MTTAKTPPHQWVWADQQRRYAFGDRDKPYSVDVWRCSRCNKVVTSRGSSTGPASGRCKKEN